MRNERPERREKGNDVSTETVKILKITTGKKQAMWKIRKR